MKKIGFNLPGRPDTFRVEAGQLHHLRPHRYPMVLLEEITECNVLEKRLTGTKMIRADDPYVEAHFPGDPIMPPCFVVEAMAQTAGCLMNVLYLFSSGFRFWELPVEEFDKLSYQPQNALAESKIKQLGLAVAGERLTMQAKVVLQRKDAFAFHVTTSVGDRPIAAGEMILAYPSYLPPSTQTAPSGRRLLMSLVECVEVTKTYQLGETMVPALRHVSMAIEKGDFAAIWGPSGSGKTSLLNLIGLLDTPTSGRIEINGQIIAAQDDSSLAVLRNKLIGFIFQSFNLVPVLSAIENVMLPLQIRGESAKQAQGKAASKLDQVGLSALYKSRPDQMSGGQRQRVAIARALVTEPAIVLADEPTANLDSETSSQILSIMRDMNRRENVTFIFSTHDPRLLDSVSRKIRLQDGQIAALEESYVLPDHRTS